MNRSHLWVLRDLDGTQRDYDQHQVRETCHRPVSKPLQLYSGQSGSELPTMGSKSFTTSSLSCRSLKSVNHHWTTVSLLALYLRSCLCHEGTQWANQLQKCNCSHTYDDAVSCVFQTVSSKMTWTTISANTTVSQAVVRTAPPCSDSLFH